MEPPQVTISDPSSAGTADLLEAGRDPWRPSRRHVVAVVASVLVAALVAGLVLRERHDRREAALDAASAEGIVLAAVAAVDPLGIGLTNLTPDPLRVRTATIEPGGTSLRVDGQLVPGLPFPLPWEDTRPCSLDVLRRPLDRVTVELVTSRGIRVTKALPLTGQVDEVNELARSRCDHATPLEAFEAGSHTTRVPRGVVVSLTLVNHSVLPLALTSLTTPAGMTMTGVRLPLVLPPDRLPPGGFFTEIPAGHPVRVRLVLRITDCTTFLRDGSLLNRAALDGVVTGPTDSSPVVIGLDGTTWDAEPGPDGFAAFYELAHDCGRRSG